MSLNQASLLYHILNEADCRPCDNGSDLLRDKRKDPQIGQLAHASRGVFRPKIVLPAASDAATGLVFQSTFGSFLSLRLQIEIMRWPIPHWQIQVP